MPEMFLRTALTESRIDKLEEAVRKLHDELVARGMITRDPTPLSSSHVRARAGWIRDRVRFGRTR